MLGALGSIEIASALIVLFVFEHTPYPWGAGTLPDGLGQTDAAINQTMRWQANVLISTVGAGFVGALFLLAGCVTYLVFKLIPKGNSN
jgi:hypothetical protein